MKALITDDGGSGIVQQTAKPTIQQLVKQTAKPTIQELVKTPLPEPIKQEVINEPAPIVIEPVKEEDMTAFKNTILGKILKGAAKVVKPIAAIAGAVLGIGAISGVVKGIGAAAGVATELKGIGKVVSTVSQSAVNLVTGTTADERAQVKEVTTAAKAEQDKLDQVQRLIDAGATRAQAEKMVGVTATELGAANSAAKDVDATLKLATQTPDQIAAAIDAEKIVAASGTPIMTAGGGCMVVAFTLLIKGAIIGTFITLLFS
jgi:hypothetical protein